MPSISSLKRMNERWISSMVRFSAIIPFTRFTRRMTLAGYMPFEPWCLPFWPTRTDRGSRPSWTYLRSVASEKRMPRLVKTSTI